MGKTNIFISYRRKDSQNNTDRIFDRLVKRYGYESIFKDVDSISAGKQFDDEIMKSLSKTDIFLLIIGKNWVGKLEDGSIRIDNEDDFVRIELEEAINLELVIIPILVNDASIPNDLPKSLMGIKKINALKVRADPDFKNDIKRLYSAIDNFLPKKRKWFRSKWLLVSLFVSFIVLSIVARLYDSNDTQPVKSRVVKPEENKTPSKTEYYKHGELKKTYTYKDSVLTGATEYFISGNKKFIYEYNDKGEVDGVIKGYFDDKSNTLKSKFYYKNNKSGKYEEYNRDGSIKETGLYINNKRIPANSYYPNGNINHKNIFKNNKLSKEITYYENGNKLAEIEYDLNEKKIKHIVYTSVGKIKSKKIFDDTGEKDYKYNELG